LLTVFLAFSFQRRDEELVRRVEALLESHGVRVETGENLGGQALTPAVKKRIEDSDALVALLTRRDQLVGGGWSTHDWVRDELNHARTKRKLAIALVEAGINTGGAYQEHERIEFDPRTESVALVKLSQNIAEWKRQVGGLIKVRILPDDLSQTLASLPGGAKCEARITREGKTSKWLGATLVPEPGGVYAYVRGALEDALIQLRVKVPGETWMSRSVPQWMDATLTKV
jgi:TIR domain